MKADWGRFFGVLGLCAVALGCATPRGATVEERRSHIRQMRDSALTDLYASDPAIQGRLNAAAGSAVFSNLNLQLFLIGAGQGYGVARDHATGQDTFMRAAEFGLGVGIGGKDARLVFIFQDRVAFRRFLDFGIELAAEADAAAIVEGDTGAQASAEGSISSSGAAASGTGSAGTGSDSTGISRGVGAGFEVYQLTRNGLALKAMVAGTRYWVDGELN
jgi:lipid-binding SYLF domain-containing protein